MKKIILLLVLILTINFLYAEDGYRLWLRYDKISNTTLLSQYKKAIASPFVLGESATIQVIKQELSTALSGLTGTNVVCNNATISTATLLFGIASNPGFIKNFSDKINLTEITGDGYAINSVTIYGKKRIIVAAKTDIGLLYGAFRFLRHLQTNQSIEYLNIVSSPLLKLRMLNHWDNLDRTVERGYAGFSLWNWHKLPVYIDKRYIDYARANASIGINAVSLTNVNANATVLTKPYLEKVKALADAFRPYGIKVFLTARFSAPAEIGGLKTADPLNDTVQTWWNDKVKEIYSVIPDFGGFVVKANSEGQPGPQNYNRNHADGANMMADAVAPFNGIIIWRAFVYSNENPEDRHKQANNEFVPLDGKFRNNVMVQVKNGAIDFQPREPFHPLFGAMSKTPLMMEFQVTQEYLGQSTNFIYLAPLFKECLESDTYARGKGSTVAKIIDGSVHPYSLTGMTGVANIGNDINWCGHPFAQSNWYALGRLAWDHQLTSEQIADEWLRMTFTNNHSFIEPIKKMMLASRENLVKYMTPLGLHHLMGTGHHYGPAPWINNLSRPEWNPAYYHKADSYGVGFDRTAKASNAVAQYATEVKTKFENTDSCPEEYLLWFHHVPWDYKMKNGETLWTELCTQYYAGVDSVRGMQKTWDSLQDKIDAERYTQVKMLLQIQEEEAVWWRNACLLYFQNFSKMPLPAGYEKPGRTLDYYKQLNFPYAPGN